MTRLTSLFRALPLCFCSLSLFAQAVAPNSTDSSKKEETVVLSPFTITATQPGRYQSTEATSGGRIRSSVIDATQSISVITREVIEDVGAMKILDAAKYTSGLTESTIPNGLDRIAIRGFQTESQVVDGFRSVFSQANLDPVFVERIEIVKGPNAIISPAGQPGGTINNVTRKPELGRNYGSISGEVGIYDSERMEFDFNQVLGADGNVSFRVVGAIQDTQGFAHDDKRGFAVMPMLRIVTKRGADLTLQLAYTDWNIQNYFGIPVDPSAGTNTGANLLAGVSRKLNTYDDDYRFERRPEFRGIFTAPITDSISLRLATRYQDYDIGFVQNLQNPGATGGSRDPLTGNYIPGMIFGTTAPFAGTPAVPQSRIMARAGARDQLHITNSNTQADLVYQLKTNAIAMTTLAGVAFNYYRDHEQTDTTTKASINYDAPVAANYVVGPISRLEDVVNYDEQVYLSETVALVDNRVVLNAGYSYSNYDLGIDNLLTKVRTRVSVDKDLIFYGAVVKPLKNVAVYYGYSESAVPQNTLTIQAGGPTLQVGTQKEYGIRFQALDNRLYATLAHFDIQQSNFSIPNPANLAIPTPVPPLPNLLSDRTCKGWEFEIRANLTDQVSLVGNYTSFKNRDPNNVPFRGTAEQAGGLLINYKFAGRSALSRLSIGAGVNYVGKFAGDAASGVTPASTPTNVIPNQPTWYIPARTLLDVFATYKINEHWKTQLNIANLLDDKYINASVNRFVVFPGNPFNARLKVTYSF